MPLETRMYVVMLLNRTLACMVDLRSQIKQANWNIKGKEVFQLQAFFATVVTEFDAYVDLVAERIAVLGGVACGTVRIAASQSTLPEYPWDIVEGSAHILALAERFAHSATAVRENIVHATDVEDAGTAAVYTDICRGIETRLRFLDAYLRE
jgi:starvation-inducible DNA-binding protein